MNPTLEHTSSFSYEERERFYELTSGSWSTEAWATLKKQKLLFPVPCIGIFSTIDIPEFGAMLAWQDFRLADYPSPIGDQELVTVVDRDQKLVTAKLFLEFTAQDIEMYSHGFYLVRALENLSDSNAWSLSPEQFTEIENTQAASNWRQIAKEHICAIEEEEAGLVSALVVHRESAYPDAPFLALYGDDDDSPISPLNSATYEIQTPQGKKIAKKQFGEFTTMELVQYAIGHYWIEE